MSVGPFPTEPGRCRVLVVDDDSDTQFILPAALTFAGYETRVVGDGIAALASIRAEQPDVVILDLAMPLLNGSDVLSALKARQETRNIPVIACTATGSLADVPKLLQEGFDEVLLKPVDPGVVLRAVERVHARQPRNSSEPKPAREVT